MVPLLDVEALTCKETVPPSLAVCCAMLVMLTAEETDQLKP